MDGWIPVKVVGFDQASKVTGYGIFEDGKLTKYGTLEASGETETRIKDMFRGIVQLIAEENPDAVCIEGTHFQNNQNAFKLLAQLQGMIMGVCELVGMPLYEYPPVLWRSVAGIKEGRGVKREELKRLAVEYVKEHFGVECSNDEAEAIVISYVGYTKLKGCEANA